MKVPFIPFGVLVAVAVQGATTRDIGSLISACESSKSTAISELFTDDVSLIGWYCDASITAEGPFQTLALSWFSRLTDWIEEKEDFLNSYNSKCSRQRPMSLESISSCASYMLSLHSEGKWATNVPTVATTTTTATATNSAQDETTGRMTVGSGSTPSNTSGSTVRSLTGSTPSTTSGSNSAPNAESGAIRAMGMSFFVVNVVAAANMIQIF